MVIQRRMWTIMGHFEYGGRAEVLGILHMDVVPAGSGWDTDHIHQQLKMENSMRVVRG